MGGGGGELLAAGEGVRGEGEGGDGEGGEDAPIFEKHNTLLHGRDKTEKFVSSHFMKKYIHVARALKVCAIISYYYVCTVYFI